jgi:sigma-B regulation protein RsbU (phosphoserine phosphatase)
VGRPLGVAGDTSAVHEGRTALAPGQGVLLFTDGLTEGRPVRRSGAEPLAMYGEERARRVLLEHRGAPPAVVLDALVSGVISFAEGRLADDLCLVAVRVPPGEAAAGR